MRGGRKGGREGGKKKRERERKDTRRKGELKATVLCVRASGITCRPEREWMTGSRSVPGESIYKTSLDIDRLRFWLKTIKLKLS